MRSGELWKDLSLNTTGIKIWTRNIASIDQREVFEQVDILNGLKFKWLCKWDKQGIMYIAILYFSIRYSIFLLILGALKSMMKTLFCLMSNKRHFPFTVVCVFFFHKSQLVPIFFNTGFVERITTIRPRLEGERAFGVLHFKFLGLILERFTKTRWPPIHF